ncbi:hypothetical protein LDO51_17250 [Providencia alcalifaciens]|uniref:hypothetical protein n=1 Tax=Providencia alcalifaciens TaxID=126385 RepID=UPI001CE16D60|nr:hypothetical protein LDO51_17250 [Providencia alcalifaciens]
MKNDECVELEADNAEFIPKLEKAQVSIDNPPGFVFMKFVFSDPRLNEETREMQNIEREPVQSFMVESVAKDLLTQLERHFYGSSDSDKIEFIKYLM